MSVAWYHEDIQSLVDKNITRTRSSVMNDAQGTLTRLDIKRNVFML